MVGKRTTPPAITWLRELLSVSAPLLVLLGYLLLSCLVEPPQLRVVRFALALPLAFFASGYALLVLLLAHYGALDFVERLALAGCLSLALGGAVFYGLARLPSGLHLEPLLAAMALFSLGCFLARCWQWRTGVRPAAPAASDSPRRPIAWRRSQRGPDRIVTLGLLALLIAGAWRLYSTTQVAIPDPAMVEFYLLDKNGAAQDYAQAVAAGETVDIVYGIVNRTEETVDCQVFASSDGSLLASGAPLRLAPGAAHQASLTVAAPQQASGLARLDFTLARWGGAWRTLWLWLEVTPAEPLARQAGDND